LGGHVGLRLELTVQFLKHGVRIEELSAAESIIIEKMWDCGLLLIDAQPISSSIAKKTNVPSSLLLKKRFRFFGQ
jgi:hypothetical protein